MTSESIHWIAGASQAALLLVAIATAILAFVQLHSAKRFELLKLLEDSETREARHTLFHQVVKMKRTDRWWDAPGLDKAAARVCASFDIIGIMAHGCNRRFFVREWAHGICWTHEALKPYLEDRRSSDPRAYHGFHKLYGDAKPYHQKA